MTASNTRFLRFQGEAVLDLVHKGTCSNHIRDITNLLKNHLTITASNLDDLEEDVILKKLSKITSTYNFQERAAPTEEKFAIGTNYSKVVPTKEINSTKRDEFWRKEEEVEKARVASEQNSRKLANLKLEEERLKREQSEHLKREQLNKEPAKKLAPAPVVVAPVSPVKTVEPSKPRAEEMRNDRRKEAQELIGNRVNTAKAMFQQQAAQSSAPVSAAPPAKPIRKTIPIQKVEPEPAPVVEAPKTPMKIEIPVAEPEPEPEPEPTPIPTPAVTEDDDEQFSTIKRSPKTPTTPDSKHDNGFIMPADNANHQPIEQQVEISAAQPREPEEGELLKAVALYDYQAVDETEISFDPGDIITHIDQIDEGETSIQPAKPIVFEFPFRLVARLLGALRNVRTLSSQLRRADQLKPTNCATFTSSLHLFFLLQTRRSRWSDQSCASAFHYPNLSIQLFEMIFNQKNKTFICM